MFYGSYQFRPTLISSPYKSFTWFISIYKGSDTSHSYFKLLEAHMFLQCGWQPPLPLHVPVLKWLCPQPKRGLLLLKSCLGLSAPPLAVWACWHLLQRSWIVGTQWASEGRGSEERGSLILPSTWLRLLGPTHYRLACSANLYDCRPLARNING